MAFGEDLYTRLTTDVTLSGLIGTRVYPGRFKQQATNPKVRYRQITGPAIHVMGQDINIERHTYQFDIQAQNYTDARAVLDALVARLRRWSADGVVQDSYKTNVRDNYDDDTDSHMVSVDFDFIVEV